MATISLIEFTVYGLVAYGGVVISMASMLLPLPPIGGLAMLRTIFLVPSVIMLWVLAGVTVVVMDAGHSELLTEYTGSIGAENIATITQVTVQPASMFIYTSYDPQANIGLVWPALHTLLGLVVALYTVSMMWHIIIQSWNSARVRR